MLENTKLESLLNDPSLLAKKAYVAGEWVTAKNGKTFDVINPATGEVIASLPDLDVKDAKHAIDAAAIAQKNGHGILAKNVRLFYVKCII